MLSNKELLSYKGKIHTYDDFKAVIKEKNLNYSEKELKEAYNNFLEICKDEVNLDDLNEVSGGFGAGSGNRGPTHANCRNCRTSITIPAGCTIKCPKCGTLNDENNCRHGLC